MAKARTKRVAKSRTAKEAAVKIPKLQINMPLDEKKIAAIQRCLSKGRLTITISRVDLLSGRAGDPYLYD